MSFYGMDSTYASTIAIMRRIFQLEAERLGTAQPGAVAERATR